MPRLPNIHFSENTGTGKQTYTGSGQSRGCSSRCSESRYSTISRPPSNWLYGVCASVNSSHIKTPKLHTSLIIDDLPTVSVSKAIHLTGNFNCAETANRHIYKDERSWCRHNSSCLRARQQHKYCRSQVLHLNVFCFIHSFVRSFE